MIHGDESLVLCAASTAILVALAASAVSAEPAHGFRPTETRARLECGVFRTCCFMASASIDPLDQPRPSTPLFVARVGIPITGDSGLSHPVVKRYVARHASQLGSCYPRRLPAKPGEGDIGMQLVILPAGKVELIGAIGFDAEVTSCIANVVKSIAFPRSSSGEITHTFVPITFDGERLASSLRR